MNINVNAMSCIVIMLVSSMVTALMVRILDLVQNSSMAEHIMHWGTRLSQNVRI